jgi:glycosyltransferase involved in cell wall biosynthesis
VLIELTWPKQRILEVYANIAELGDGIYGVGAASDAYFRIPPLPDSAPRKRRDWPPYCQARAVCMRIDPALTSMRRAGWIEQQMNAWADHLYRRPCPELIPALVEQWRAGFDVVYATRSAREGETGFKRFTAAAFYRSMNQLSDTAIPRDTGDFRLLSRRALDALAQLRERQRFMKGLFSWIGYRQTAVRYLREPRQAGTTKWNYWRLAQLAIEGITSFSTAPLRLATWVGIASAGLAFVYGFIVLIRALFYGDAVRGYPTLMLVILFLGGVQLLALGVIGEYLGRNYAESKRRPLYFIEEQRQPRKLH